MKWNETIIAAGIPHLVGLGKHGSADGPDDIGILPVHRSQCDLRLHYGTEGRKAGGPSVTDFN